MPSLATRARASARSWRQVLRAFYSRPLAYGAAIFVSAILAYAGGGIMFWLHAIYRGEDGPPISHWQHWLLDSTLGFVALTPVVLVILPAVLFTLGWQGRKADGVRVGAYVFVVGMLFALVTGPGPLLHNAIAGAGTPLANLATDVFGRDPRMERHHTEVPERSAFTEGVLQVAVGVPAYSLLTLASIAVVRRVAQSGRRTGRRDRGRGSGGARAPTLTHAGG